LLSRNREELAFLTALTYTLRRQVWVNLTRMSVLMNRIAGKPVSAERLDRLFGNLAREMRPEEIEQITVEDLFAGIDVPDQPFFRRSLCRANTTWGLPERYPAPRPRTRCSDHRTEIYPRPVRLELRPETTGFRNQPHSCCIEQSEADSFRHPEWREGPDPTTARQPGEPPRCQGQPAKGRCGEQQREQRLVPTVSFREALSRPAKEMKE
jgi:hypothetical protein